MSTEQQRDWEHQYAALYPRLEAFTEKFHGLVADLLSRNGVEPARTEWRTKSPDSFAEKVIRKRYQDPFSQMTDLCGLRIVMYYLEDIEAVGAILTQEFHIDPKNSVDKGAETDPDRFGYLSVHYIATLKEPRTLLPEWKPYADMRVEIQLRTILQHAWAAIDHKLRYKGLAESPPELRRALFRLSALLELGDFEFSRIRQNTVQLISQYASDMSEGELEINLNLDSLGAYLEQSEVFRRLTPSAVEAGFQAYSTLLDEHVRDDGLRNVFRVLVANEVGTIRELHALLKGVESEAPDILSYVRLSAARQGFTPVANPYDVLTILVLHHFRQMVTSELLRSLRYGPELTEAIALCLQNVA